MSYSVSPDNPSLAFDPEAGASGAPTIKPGGYRTPEAVDDRAGDRDAARVLDEMVELADLTRARKDLERAFPRAMVAGVPVRKRRALPEPDAIRTPPSSRQRKARSKAKHAAQDQLSAIGYKALNTLISTPQTWEDIGKALSDARGDAQHLDDKARVQVQRIDRAIQTAEKVSDRGHIVYCAARLPHAVPASATDLPAELREGSRLDFDRFTMTAHSVHQLDATMTGQDVVFEIETDRGMYLGRSDKVDDTAHLLPRGMRFEVVSAGEGRYRRPDGSIGRRMIVQLRDVTAPNEES